MYDAFIANLGPVKKYFGGRLRATEDSERNKGVFMQKNISPEVRALFASCRDAENTAIYQHSSRREEEADGGKEEEKEEVEFSPVIDGSLERFRLLGKKVQKKVLESLSISSMATFLTSCDDFLRRYVDGEEGLALEGEMERQVVRFSVQSGSGNLSLSLPASASYQRLLLHSLCTYYGLKSKTLKGESSSSFKTVVVTKHGGVEDRLKTSGSLPVPLPRLLQISMEELVEEEREETSETMDISSLSLK